MGEIETLINQIKQIKELPAVPPMNFFDITGIRNKEVINSKVLSYFLDANREHSLGTLFFDSFVTIIDQKKDIHRPAIDITFYTPEFIVEEEESTNNVMEQTDQRKRIDLLLKGDNWAIIIENKLYHELINPLSTYWHHVKEDHKIGIILSLFKIDEKKCSSQNLTFINITHQELIGEVKRRLEERNNYPETSRFYLSEYFKTIESHYKEKANAPIMNEIINSLINNRKEINELRSKQIKAEKFLEEAKQRVFAAYNYDTNGKHYNSPEIATLHFSVNTSDLLSSNQVVIYFSVYINENTDEEIGRIKNQLKPIQEAIIKENKSFRWSKDYKNQVVFLVYESKNFLEPKDVDFETKLKHILDTYYFNPNGIVDIINKSKLIKAF